MSRERIKPRFCLTPLKAVRWRSHSRAYSTTARTRWRIYLFGLFPIASLPRKEGR